jgi:tetratricopeptide (TPR) repeat protein
VKNWIAPLVVVGFISLVLVPIAFERSAGWQARWALARAANAADLGVGDAQAELEKAEGLLEEPRDERDYWNVRLKIALSKDDSSSTQVVREALAYDSDRLKWLPYIAARQYTKLQKFKPALEMLELWYSHRPATTAVELNELAYSRSLAGVELEKGVKEIDKALAIIPKEPALLDTRAWLYYQLGRYEEALEDASLAVDLADSEYENLHEGYLVKLTEMLAGKARPTGKDGLYSQSEVEPGLWSLGVLHYHRGKILEALDRQEQAEMEWQWLAKRKLPADQRLH